MNFSGGLNSFYKPCSTKFVKFAQYLFAHADLTIWIHFRLQYCKFQQPGYYDFSAVTFSNYITHILSEAFSQNFFNCNRVNVHWIYPGLISGCNITEKNILWVAGLRKNIKSCQIKGSSIRSSQKSNPVTSI